MMKHFMHQFILLFLFISSVHAQQHSSSIKQAALEMGNALVKKDGDQFIKYMHPSMISLAGGKAQLKLLSDSIFKVAEQIGGKVSKISFGSPSPVITHKNTLQSVITQQMVVSTLLGDAELSSALIALSTDNGKSWTFIDTNLFNLNKIKTAMPDISPQLIIPKAAPPKFTLNQQ
jgi:hypothetical protein